MSYSNQQVFCGSRPAAESVYATIVSVCPERGFAFARDRDDRQIFVHFSRGRQALERGRLLWLSEDVEKRQPEEGDKVFLKVVPGDRGPWARFWGFAPQAFQDPSRYQRMWYQEVNLAEFTGCQVTISRLADRCRKIQEEMGEVAEIMIHGDQLIISFLWRARRERNSLRWLDCPRWQEQFDLTATQLRWTSYGRQRLDCYYGGENDGALEITLYPPGRHCINQGLAADLRLNPQYCHTSRAM